MKISAAECTTDMTEVIASTCTRNSPSREMSSDTIGSLWVKGKTKKHHFQELNTVTACSGIFKYFHYLFLIGAFHICAVHQTKLN
jgi:hypothetical protein